MTMILQAEDKDGINIVLLGAGLFIVFVIGTIVFAVYRWHRRLAASKQASGKEN